MGTVADAGAVTLLGGAGTGVDAPADQEGVGHAGISSKVVVSDSLRHKLETRPQCRTKTAREIVAQQHRCARASNHRLRRRGGKRNKLKLHAITIERETWWEREPVVRRKVGSCRDEENAPVGISGVKLGRAAMARDA